MAEPKKTTLFQSLTQTLNLGGSEPIVSNDDEIKREILKATTPLDQYIKKLELQQQEFLKAKFKNVNDNSLQRILQYEATKLQAYFDNWFCIRSIS